MIENLRKYNGLIIFSLILVGVALVIGLQSSNSRAPGDGNPYIRISGRTYSDEEYRKLGIGGHETLMMLLQSGDFQKMISALQNLSPNSFFGGKDNDASEAFFINRMLVRQAKQELGIHPGEEEVSEYIRNLQSFKGADDKFDAERYQRFIERGLGRLGMSQADLRELIADVIATDRLRELVGSGLSSHKEAVAVTFALDRQTITGEVASLDAQSLRDSIKPTDDQLKGYWELIQDSFKTEPQRRFSYLLASPQATPETSAPATPEPTALEQAALSNEAKKNLEKQKAEKEAAVAEARRKAQRDLDTIIDDLAYELELSKGNDFEKLAADKGLKIQSTALFTRSNPPAELDLNLRTGAAGGSAIEQLFALTPAGDDALSKISQPLAVGENQWLLARLDEEIPSRTMTFEEAREKALAQYIEEEARKQLTKVITEAAATVRKEMTSGSDFAAATTKAGLEKLHPFLKINKSHKATAPEEPQDLFGSARNVEPGSISDPVYSGSRAYLIHVTSREVVNDEKALEQEADVVGNQYRIAAFSDWLVARKEAAEVKALYSSGP